MNYLRLLILIATVTIFVGCKKGFDYTTTNQPTVDNKEDEEEQIGEDLTQLMYRSIDGEWKLIEWRGERLTEDTYLHISFDSREQRFEMRDNLGSMYEQVKSGNFNISRDEQDRYILWGNYDNGVGDWNDDYILTFDQERMTWQRLESEEMMVFDKLTI